jgi:hypothetical protein
MSWIKRHPYLTLIATGGTMVSIGNAGQAGDLWTGVIGTGITIIIVSVLAALAD